ncbi:hypothetical protein [Echinicola sp. 20G]|uniref:hypothetical protein n=1 Tax=Echinicola sp. 20G TaxID=2781961 RepID=UPI001910FAC1|nr:hypothetical protein [Echinicola sp. 20G]
MKTKRLFYFIGILVMAMVIWMVSDTISQPGVKDLKMDFIEVAFYRNENNTGPIKRIYAVTVEDTIWSEMRKYGELMPHTKYGNTQVFFFLSSQESPEKLRSEPPYFDVRFDKYCVGKFEKKPMGEESFSKYPFKNN